jgi:hypothetical protein
MSLERGIGLLGWLLGSHDYAHLLQAWKSVPLSLPDFSSAFMDLRRFPVCTEN